MHSWFNEDRFQETVAATAMALAGIGAGRCIARERGIRIAISPERSTRALVDPFMNCQSSRWVQRAILANSEERSWLIEHRDVGP